MASGPVYIVGFGGHGRDVLQVVRSAGLDFAGFVDDAVASDPTGRYAVHDGGDLAALPRGEFVVAVGSPNVRRRLAERFGREGFTSCEPVVHPAAWVGSLVTLGAGSVIFAGSSLSTDITVGSHVHINQNCAVAHDVVLADFVTLAPGACLSGNVVVEREVDVGTGAVVLQGLTLGAGARVGAGAVVTKDVAPGATVVGVPARPMDREAT